MSATRGWTMAVLHFYGYFRPGRVAREEEWQQVDDEIRAALVASGGER